MKLETRYDVGYQFWVPRVFNKYYKEYREMTEDNFKNFLKSNLIWIFFLLFQLLLK